MALVHRTSITDPKTQIQISAKVVNQRFEHLMRDMS
jgi:hypothetical protein